MTVDLARRVDEAGINALPALRQIVLDGWLLRFADGCTRRANSVNPLRTVPADELSARIDQAAALYAAQGLPALVRISSFQDPALSRALDAKAYAAPEGETRVLLCSDPAGQAELSTRVEMHARPTQEWLESQARIAGDAPRVARAREAMLAGLCIPARFGGIRLDGAGSPLASMAAIAIHDGVACINMVATDPTVRRRGLARTVLRHLLAWAATETMQVASLQVATGNAAANPLYAGPGFGTELYRYHYRRGETPG